MPTPIKDWPVDRCDRRENLTDLLRRKDEYVLSWLFPLLVRYKQEDEEVFRYWAINPSFRRAERKGVREKLDDQWEVMSAFLVKELNRRMLGRASGQILKYPLGKYTKRDIGETMYNWIWENFRSKRDVVLGGPGFMKYLESLKKKYDERSKQPYKRSAHFREGLSQLFGAPAQYKGDWWDGDLEELSLLCLWHGTLDLNLSNRDKAALYLVEGLHLIPYLETPYRWINFANLSKDYFHVRVNTDFFRQDVSVYRLNSLDERGVWTKCGEKCSCIPRSSITASMSTLSMTVSEFTYTGVAAATVGGAVGYYSQVKSNNAKVSKPPAGVGVGTGSGSWKQRSFIDQMNYLKQQRMRSKQGK